MNLWVLTFDVAVTFFSCTFQLSSASTSSPLYISPDLSSACREWRMSQTINVLWADPQHRQSEKEAHRDDMSFGLMQELDRYANSF